MPVESSISTTDLLKALRFAGGIDIYPQIFQYLFVVFWAVHMFFINLTIGHLFLSLYAYMKKKKDPKMEGIAGSAIKIGIISLSLGIVFGVAPLLFTQTIYDELWYTTNNLSASLVIAFIPAVIVAYYAAYAFYLRKKNWPTSFNVVLLIVSIALVLFAAVSMHTFTYEGLFPDKWIEWYTNGGQTMNTDGWHIYAFSLPRYLVFILMSFFVTGVFQMAYSWYFIKRSDMDQAVLAERFALGKKMAIVFGALTIADWMLYAALQGVLFQPIVLILTPLLVLIWAMVMILGRTFNQKMNAILLIAAFIFVTIISVLREAIRVIVLAGFHHSINDYPVYLNVLPFMFFLGTFATAFSVLFHVLYVLYKGGRQQGVYDARGNEVATTTWNFALYLLIIWTIIYWGVGIFVVSHLS